METQNQNVPARRHANVAVTRDMIDKCASPRDIFDLPAVRDNWITKYSNTRRKSIADATMQYEAEKVLLLQLMAGSTALQNCSKESLYACGIELAISGTSLRDGGAYIVPKGKKAVFMVGWKGRLDMISDLQTVIKVDAPQVVYDCDVFDFSLGVNPTIHDHRPGRRTADSLITYAYVVIYHHYGHQVIIMDREEILSIRNNKSDSYKKYVKDMAAADENGMLQGQYGPYKPEAPMWVTDEAQAFRKTVVHRAYNNCPKSPQMKYLDKKAMEAYGMDPDSFVDDISEMDIEHEMEAFDKETGEVFTEAEDVTDAATTGGTRAQTQPGGTTTQQQPQTAQQQPQQAQSGELFNSQAQPITTVENPNESF